MLCLNVRNDGRAWPRPWHRNPLHALTDSANFIMESCKPSDGIYEDVSIIVSGALQMSQLLVNIMDWTKVSVGQLELKKEHVDVSTAVKQLVRGTCDCAPLLLLSPPSL